MLAEILFLSSHSTVLLAWVRFLLTSLYPLHTLHWLYCIVLYVILPDGVLHLPAHTEPLPRLKSPSHWRLSLVLHGSHGGRVCPHVAGPDHDDDIPAGAGSGDVNCLQECLNTWLFSEAGEKTNWAGTDRLSDYIRAEQRKERFSFYKIPFPPPDNRRAY